VTDILLILAAERTINTHWPTAPPDAAALDLISLDDGRHPRWIHDGTDGIVEIAVDAVRRQAAR
jgi:hypothetical protein